MKKCLIVISLLLLPSIVLASGPAYTQGNFYYSWDSNTNVAYVGELLYSDFGNYLGTSGTIEYDNSVFEVKGCGSGIFYDDEENTLTKVSENEFHFDWTNLNKDNGMGCWIEVKNEKSTLDDTYKAYHISVWPDQGFDGIDQGSNQSFKIINLNNENNNVKENDKCMEAKTNDNKLTYILSSVIGVILIAYVVTVIILKKKINN